MLLSLVASKMTGVVYDWNENGSYAKRVDLCFRNKWFMRCRDARLVDFFLGGS